MAGRLLLLVIALTATTITYFYFVVRFALPQLDGSLRVEGLTARVTVTRDTHGVPAIEAQTLEDLFFAQGYVTAQDRLWQMDAMRRFAGGELSQVLGEGLIQHDREQRILGLRATAKQAVERLPARDRSYFEAYAGGVNAYIQERRDRLPIEFRILKYAPSRWRPEDSIVIANQMVKDLNHGQFKDVLAREKILARLGPELSADLYVNRSWHDRPPTVMRESLEQQNNSVDSDQEDNGDDDAGDDNAVTRSARPSTGTPVLPDPAPTNGSNNWVVSGAHTVTGKPLLSNDMHLGHQMPNLWYEAHLRAGSLDVAGVTLPGMPYVIVGHNQRIAWGFTNVGPDVQDLYVEKLDPDNPQRYMTPSGWHDVEVRHEQIKLRKNFTETSTDTVNLDVRVTRHGPIVFQKGGKPYALRWTALDPKLNDAAGLYSLNRAVNWKEFTEAVRRYTGATQNMVYLDVDGHIGYYAAGVIPVRKSGDGSLPYDGSTDAGEWSGFIPFEELPHLFDPPSGIIVTANQRIVGTDYPYFLTHSWAQPYRARRILDLLQKKEKMTAENLARPANPNSR